MSTTLITAVVAAAGAAYLLLLQRPQRQRLTSKELDYAGLTRDEIYAKITLEDAEIISRSLGQLNFPWIYKTALQFALFRTYAIPTISAILKKNGQLCEPKNAGRRYSDTSVLISEFSTWSLNSERASLAIARMNYLHSLYPEILARDELYTLLLFATQPIEFISRYEWRQPTELEKAASWKFWTEVGLRMKIPLSTIPSNFEAMQATYVAYEKQYMVPVETNNYVGGQTVELLLHWVPSPGRWLGRQMVYALLDERLRVAMMFPKAQAWVEPMIAGVFAVRRWWIRFLALPRTKPLRQLCEEGDPKTGRYFVKWSDNEPWYVKPTIANRYGLWALMAWVMGKPAVGQKGFGEEGYVIEKVGPMGLENSGVEKVRAEAEAIRRMGDNRCPFA